MVSHEVSKCIDRTVNGLEHRKQITLAEMLRGKQAVFQVEVDELTRPMLRNMMAQVNVFKSPGGPRYIRRKVYSTDHDGQQYCHVISDYEEPAADDERTEEVMEMVKRLKSD